MTEEKIHKEYAEVVYHHIYHKPEEDEKNFKREISINGNIFTVELASDHPDEDIDFLCEKALQIFKKLKEEK